MPKQYDVPLRLVTPHMHGPKVKDAQWLMAGNSKIKGLGTYKDGKLDSDYGPLTAQATQRTKYWLGFPNNAIDQVFGQVLYEYLLPGSDRKLPADYKTRRAKRIAAATPGKNALAKAISQIGYEESPFGSNNNKYGVWYRMNRVAWCAIFESWCFGNSGYSRFRYSYVPNIHYDAKINRNKLMIVRSPQPGDIVCYTLHGSVDAHTAFFEKWISPGKTFWDVGGNTGPTNISNGGAVMRQKRKMGMVNVFVRVQA